MVGDILYGQDIREKMLLGINTVSNAIKMTIGPKGRAVLLTQKSGRPLIIKDGAAAVRSIEMENPYENMGVQIIKEAATKVSDSVGDGVAVAILLANTILQEGAKNIAAGANAIELRKGIQGAVQLSCAAIRKLAWPAEDLEDIRCISAISAQDELAGELVFRAMKQIGTDGVISVEETPNTETTLEITEGMQYEKGYLNGEMLKDQGSMHEEMDDPYIFVTDYEISNAQDILPLLEQIRIAGRPLLIIAEKITGSALSALILNKKKGIVNVVAVHPPAYGDGRRERMEDICIFTGGSFITEQLGYNLKDTRMEMLGMAEKVIISKNSTAIINGKGDPTDICVHLNSLRHRINTEDYDFKRGRLEERLARFTGGTAVIKAGAPTESEMKALKYRLENAVRAAKAAMEEGIVPGGGSIYLDILPAVQAYAASLDGTQKTGASIVLKALEAPTRQIAANGGKNPSVVVGRIKELNRYFGYDVQRDSYVDMMKAGIVDSAKAARLALQCASSAASALLTAEAGFPVRQENAE